jgi:HAD superfamily hydrolase (TIGR01549 family)
MWGHQAIKGVLLDIDGTLVLSNDAHAHAWVEAFSQSGHAVELTQIKGLIGMGGKQIIKKILGENTAESTIEKISKDHRSIFTKKFSTNIKQAPGARELVKKLRHIGFKLIATSSATPDTLEKMLNIADVEDLIPYTVGADDVDAPKPDPEIIHEALRKIGLPKNQSLLIGDSPYDLEATKRAGIMFIGVRCGGYKDHELHGATAIYDNPHELAVNLETSPLSH